MKLTAKQEKLKAYMAEQFGGSLYEIIDTCRLRYNEDTPNSMVTMYKLMIDGKRYCVSIPDKDGSDEANT